MPKPLELSGKVFGKLTVVGRADNSTSGQTCWTCVCKCGRKKIVRANSLVRGLAQTCGCSTFVELTGQTFGSLTVISRHGMIRKAKAWLCICACGKEKIAVSSDLRKGSVTSCGCKKYRASSGTFIWRFGSDTGAGLAILRLYKLVAAKRGYSWNISDQLFFDLTQGVCNYCGSTPSNKHKRCSSAFIYNGIDRIDNTRGYETNNVVTCCRVCNMAKRDTPVKDFLSWINKVAKYTNK